MTTTTTIKDTSNDNHDQHDVASSGGTVGAGAPASATSHTAGTTGMAVPASWPPEVAELYEPIKKLGQGGFAAVILARRKDQTTCSSSNDHDEKNDGGYVAMKVVGSQEASKQEIGYAHREIEILSELDHPNIIKLIDSWETSTSSSNPKGAASVMALQYVKGPTVNDLIKRGGKLSLVFCRVVAAQLIDALAYLHSRAVVYRDLKPDNFIVTGADSSQDEIWDDLEASVEPDWNMYLARWHVTLIDFGFARALTPEDMKTHIRGSTRGSSRNLDSSTSSSADRSMNRSITKKLVKRMSAVGNRAYSAPEVQSGITKNMDLSRSRNWGSRHRSIDVTKTLSENVSMYGLTADSYSLGNTLVHMFTGIRPDQNVDEVIAAENAPIVVLCRFLCGLASGGAGTSSTGGQDGSTMKQKNRVVQHRPYSGIPAEVKRLIRELTRRDPRDRTTIRAARLYPWVDDVLVDRDVPWTTLTKVSYLSFVMPGNGSTGKKRAEQAQEQWDEPESPPNAQQPQQPEQAIEHVNLESAEIYCEA